jgi:hypothetical protein
MIISFVMFIMNVTLARGNSALQCDEIMQSYVIPLAYLKLQFNIMALQWPCKSFDNSIFSEFYVGIIKYNKHF